MRQDLALHVTRQPQPEFRALIMASAALRI